MLYVTHNTARYIEALSAFFSANDPNPRLRATGRFSIATRRIDYGLGPTWWLRYLDDSNEVLIMVSTEIDNSGASTVSWHDIHSGMHRQWKLTLVTSRAAQYAGSITSVLDWLKAMPEDQADAFSEELHAKAQAKFAETKHPVVVLDKRSHRDDADSYRDDVAVSMLYKSDESLGYCVLVYDVSSTTRNDRYAVSVKSPSNLMSNMMMQYRKGFFGRFLSTVSAAHREQSSMSHLLSFRKMSKAKPQAVCITSPSSQGVVDPRFTPGYVYDIQGFDKNMADEEFIVLRDQDNNDCERSIKHFVVYGR